MIKFTALMSLFIFSALANAEIVTGITDPFEEETRQAQEFISSSVEYKTYNYCKLGTLTCRSLVLFRDNETGVIVPSFLDKFISAGSREVASTGYFLLNSNGTFRIFGDSVFDGQIKIDRATPENQNVSVTFDSYGFPTAHNMIFKVLGTTRYSEAQMIYTPHEVTIEGYDYDSLDPEYRSYFKVIYHRQY